MHFCLKYKKEILVLLYKIQGFIKETKRFALQLKIQKINNVVCVILIHLIIYKKIIRILLFVILLKLKKKL